MNQQNPGQLFFLHYKTKPAGSYHEYIFLKYRYYLRQGQQSLAHLLNLNPLLLLQNTLHYCLVLALVSHRFEFR